MLLTPTHRRSARLTKEAYQKANCVESTPRKWRHTETQAVIKDDIEDDIYDECPELKGYEYDKDHYLANDRYAKGVDDEIKTLKEQNELDEAIKSHDEDLKNAANARKK